MLSEIKPDTLGKRVLTKLVLHIDQSVVSEQTYNPDNNDLKFSKPKTKSKTKITNSNCNSTAHN